ncbi:hypothetical protein KKC52_04025, partial [bacterium]|nr:hypothetical protein [bacterium]
KVADNRFDLLEFQIFENVYIFINAGLCLFIGIDVAICTKNLKGRIEILLYGRFGKVKLFYFFNCPGSYLFIGTSLL